MMKPAPSTSKCLKVHDQARYRLSKLPPGSYDVILNGAIIAGLVRSLTGRHEVKLTVELLIDVPQGERPCPFVESEHEFPTLEARVLHGGPFCANDR